MIYVCIYLGAFSSYKVFHVGLCLGWFFNGYALYIWICFKALSWAVVWYGMGYMVIINIFEDKDAIETRANKNNFFRYSATRYC